MPDLISLFLAPFIAAFFSYSIPALRRQAAFLMSLITPLLLIWYNSTLIGAKAHYDWIPSLSVSYSLYLDGVSYLFVVLTALIIPLLVLTAPEGEGKFSGYFFGTLFFVQGMLGGFFMAQDLVLFTLFWEGMLIPAYFLMILYGEEGAKEAAMRFLVYMIAGSCLLIAAILSLYFTSESHTFVLPDLHSLSTWVFFVFVLAFAVKTPLFPFHAWLPGAYVKSSLTTTIVLSALLSKAGIYGFYRVVLKVFPELMQQYSVPLTFLAVAGALYGAFAAFRQTHIKSLIAYSSFSHVNFILAGLFVWNAEAHGGSILQAFNHGVTITALFFVVGFLYQRLHSYELSAGGGLSKTAPLFCWFTLFFVLSAIAVPGTNNFVGEFLILYGFYSEYGLWAALLGSSLIFSCAYMLRFQHALFFGPKRREAADLSNKEKAVFTILALFVLWLGLYPQIALNLIRGAS